MTIEECLAILHLLRLTPSSVPNVFVDEDGCTWSVPNPSEYTFEERAVIFKQFEDHVNLMRGL